MRSFLRISSLGLIAGSLAVATHSFAQDFVNAKWIPLTRNGIPMGDPVGDAVGTTERDIVGDAKDPAAFVYQDATHLYFRLRVNGDPIKNGQLEQFGWGCAVEANNVVTNYEFLSVVNGIEANGPGGQADAVEWLWNQTTTNADAVGENADVVVGQFQRSTHARVIAANTSFGGDADFFLEWAVPLTTVRNGGGGAPGIAAGTTLRFACGTSNNARAYDADPVCPVANAQCTLSNTWSDPIECGVSSCGKDTDGDGVMDHVEVALGTNPNAKDTDGDNIPDDIELTPIGGGAFFPVDTDGDGTIDAKDNDSDNDCVKDSVEGAASARNASVPNANASSNCPAATPVCISTTGACVVCDGNFSGNTPAKCPFATLPKCNVGGALDGRCSECGSGETSQCTADKPACSTQTASCTACTGDFASNTIAPCPSAAARVCQTVAPFVGKCTQCSKTNTLACTGATPTCDSATAQCAPCNGDRGSGTTRVCPSASAPYCNLAGPDQGKCGTCAQSSSCGAGHTGPTCTGGACTDVDTDNDGVNDTVEGLLGTDPTKSDSDGDGIPDNIELIATGSSATDKVDTDGDGTIDALDLDSDGDGILDKDEGAVDADNDGKPNFRDTDDDNDGILTSFERADTTTSMVSDDVDGDGKKNWYDDDADGDGISDGVEGRVDQNANGKNDYLEKSVTSPVDAGVDAAVDAGRRAEGGIDGPGIEGNPVGPEDGVLEGGGFACNATPSPRFAAFGAAFFGVLMAFVLRRRRR